jgi:hypothetical protein
MLSILIHNNSVLLLAHTPEVGTPFLRVDCQANRSKDVHLTTIQFNCNLFNQCRNEFYPLHLHQYFSDEKCDCLYFQNDYILHTMKSYHIINISCIFC